MPVMEKYGVFDFLEKIGLPASDKLKSPGASNILAAYLLYEVKMPVCIYLQLNEVVINSVHRSPNRSVTP